MPPLQRSDKRAAHRAVSGVAAAAISVLALTAPWAEAQQQRVAPEPQRDQSVDPAATDATLRRREGDAALAAGDPEAALSAYVAARAIDPSDVDATLGAALALEALDRRPDALDMYARALRLSPRDPRIRYHRGLSHYRAGALPDAVRDLRASAILPNAPELALLRLADALYAAAAYQDARNAYRDAARRPNAPAAAWRGLGNADYALGDFRDAEVAYGAALSADADDVVAARYRGWTRERLGRDADALADYDQAIAAGRPGAGLLRDRADLRRRMGDLQGALLDYETALRIAPQDAPTLYGAARTTLALGRSAEAEALFDRVVDAAGPDQALAAAALRLRGVARLSRNAYEGAEADFALVIELNPNDAVAHYNRGVARLGMDDVEGATSDMRDAARLDEADAGARYALGRIALADGDRVEALRAFEEAERADPRAPEAWLDRGLALIALGRPLAALAEFDAILERDPRNLDALARRTEALLKIGRRDAALVSAEKLIDAAPGDPTGLMLVARARLAAADPNAARAALQQARAIGADPAQVSQLEAEAWIVAARRLGQERERPALQKAAESLDAAIAEGAGFDAVDRRALVRARLGDWEGATRDLDLLIDIRPTDAELRFDRAGALRALDRCQAAIDDYDAGLALRPDNVRALRARADCKWRLGSYGGYALDMVSSWF